MLRGMEEGRYIVLFPDTVATCITFVLSGTAIPSLPLWIVAPLAPIVVSGIAGCLSCSALAPGACHAADVKRFWIVDYDWSQCMSLCSRCW